MSYQLAGNAPQLSAKHREHLQSELGDDGLVIAVQLGARSIDATEASQMGFRFKGWASGGLLLPFGNGFAQLRCDHPPIGPSGDPVKYLNRAGVKQAALTIGTGHPTSASEGFKDAISLHLASGEAVQAIPGVTSWRLLAPSVEFLIYDADAQHNPGVWVPLIRAGLQRRTLRLAFFPAETAGPKGGACEYFGSGGELVNVRRWKARELLRDLPTTWNRTLRADWQARSIRCLALLATEAGMDRTAAEQLAVAGARAVGMPTKEARTIASRVAGNSRAKSITLPLDAPPDARLVAAAGTPPLGPVNAGGWATALGRGICSRLRLNLLSQEVELDGLPLRGESEELLYVTAQQAGWEIKRADCHDGTRAVSLRHAYHPVREYLDRVVADPEVLPADLDTIAARYLDVGDSLSAAMIRCLLIGAVARVLHPGCEAPGVVILRGVQGIGKSAFWQALGGQFYVVSRHEDGAKDQILSMHGSWIYDLDELDKVTTAKQAAGLRSLITTTRDNFRVPYGRREESFPRQFVIVGAVNGDGFLTDPEGNRRYWVIDCPQAKDSGQFIDGPGAARDRDAIWKAAVLAYRSGASWTLTPEEQAASNIRNGQWEAIDEWLAVLKGWAEAMDTPAMFTTREAITGAGLRNAEFVSRRDEMRAAACLKRAGFKRQENATRRPDGKRERFWTLAQPDTTSFGEVMPLKTSSGTVTPNPLAQPAQPLTKKAGGEGKGLSGSQVKGGRSVFLKKERVSVHVPDVPGRPDQPPCHGSQLTQPPAQPVKAVSRQDLPAPRSALGTPIEVDGEPGWRLPQPFETLPKGGTVHVLVVDPAGESRRVERRQINQSRPALDLEAA